MLNINNPLPTQRFQRRNQLVALIQIRNIISTTNTLPTHKNIRHSASSSILPQQSLQIRTERVLIQFNDERFRLNSVVLQQDRFRSLAVGTVGFGEDNDWIC